MLAILLLLFVQPPPATALKPVPESNGAVHVDLIIVNQYNRAETTTVYYVSFWNVHYTPPTFGGFPIYEHRGWKGLDGPITRCEDGWSTPFGRRFVTADRVLWITSDHDVEYRNRQFYNPIDR